jgi:hypothetical protein
MAPSWRRGAGWRATSLTPFAMITAKHTPPRRRRRRRGSMIRPPRPRRPPHPGSMRPRHPAPLLWGRPTRRHLGSRGRLQQRTTHLRLAAPRRPLLLPLATTPRRLAAPPPRRRPASLDRQAPTRRHLGSSLGRRGSMGSSRPPLEPTPCLQGPSSSLRHRQADRRGRTRRPHRTGSSPTRRLRDTTGPHLRAGRAARPRAAHRPLLAPTAALTAATARLRAARQGHTAHTLRRRAGRRHRPSSLKSSSRRPSGVSQRPSRAGRSSRRCALTD